MTVPPMGESRRLRILLAALALLVALSVPARADGLPPAAGPVPDDEDGELLPDGRLVSTGDGVVSLIQPEFCLAEDLVAGLRSVGFPTLSADLVAPRVVRPPRGKERGPQLVPGRLLLRGAPEVVNEARDWLGRLDRPARAVRLCLAICEIARGTEAQFGGRVLFDKNQGETPQTTVFRGFATDFRPADLLRQDFQGVRPFEGTRIAFGEPDWLHGLLEIEIDALLQRGRGRWLARPNLVVTKDAPAELEVRNHIPRLALQPYSPASGPVVTAPAQETGLKLQVTALQVGTDRATLDLVLILKIPVRIEDGAVPPGSFELRERAVRTRLTLEDRRPLVFGGLVVKGRERRRAGLPAAPAILDPILGGLAFEGLDREVWFVATIAISDVGHGEANAPNHHARRRDERRIERLRGSVR